MSHTIIFRISSQKLKEQKNQCERLENEIKQAIQKVHEKFPDLVLNFSDLLNQIAKFKNELIWLSNKAFANNVAMYRTISTFEKQVINVRYFVNQLEQEETIETLHYFLNQVNVVHIIEQYGLLGWSALQEIQKNQQTYGEEVFNKALEEQRKKFLNDEKRNKLLSFITKTLAQSNLPNKIQTHFKNWAQVYKTTQELEDLISLIQSVINNYQTLQEYMEVFNAQFFSEGFDLDHTKVVTYDLDDQGLYATYYLKNELNNTVQIKLYDNGQIQYKLGNYYGHACETTTNEILKKLQNLGYDYEIISVKRNVDNNEPLPTFLKRKLEKNEK